MSAALLELEDARLITLDAEGGRVAATAEGRERIAAAVAQLIEWTVAHEIPWWPPGREET